MSGPQSKAAETPVFASTGTGDESQTSRKRFSWTPIVGTGVARTKREQVPFECFVPYNVLLTDGHVCGFWDVDNDADEDVFLGEQAGYSLE